MHSKESILLKCKLKKISEISKDKLFDFYKKVYPKRFNSLTENWKWWYRFDKEFAEPIVLFLDGKVIGQNDIIISTTKYLQYGSKIMQYYTIYGNGSWKTLTKEWMKICPNQMVCSPYSYRVQKIWMELILKPKVGKTFNYINFSVLNKFNMSLLNAFPRYLIKNKFNDKLQIKPYNISKNFKVISESFDKKKSQIITGDLPKIDRDINWLNWRLMECPYKKDIYFFEHNNSFSIVHIYSEKKVKRMNIMFTYGVEKISNIKLYKLITAWALKNNIDYIWAIHNDKSLKNFFPKIFNRPLKLATWSSNSDIKEKLQNGFDDLQGIDSDIESGFFIE